MLSTSINELLAFVAVSETGSFTAAGRRLGLTTNAVSLRVQKLEETLAVRLLARTTRAVTLTEEGRRFFERISRVLADLEAAQEELRPGDDVLRGAVRVALPATVVTRRFLERLGTLLGAHPGLVVQTRVTAAPVNPTAEGLDIVLRVGQPPASTLIGRLLGRATWVLAAAPGYLAIHGAPRGPAELSQHRCLRLLSTPPQTEWTLIDRGGREVTVPVGGPFECDDSRVLGDATYAGIGIGVRPLGECARAEEAGCLVRVLPAYRFRPLDVYAVLPKGHLRIPRISACLEVLREAVAELQ